MDNRTSTLVQALSTLFIFVTFWVIIFVEFSQAFYGTSGALMDWLHSLVNILLLVSLFCLFGGLYSGYLFGKLRYSPSFSAPPPPARIEERSYCRYCGTENKSDASYCEKCGKSLR